MNTNIAHELISKLPIDLSDAVRLILECMEELGESYDDRDQLMKRIRRVMREGVQAVRAAEQTVSLEEAAWASVEQRRHRRPTTRRDLRAFVRRMLRVEGAGQLLLRKMTPGVCRELLDKAFPGSEHSYRKGRAILHSIFAFGIRREWCDANPVDRIEAPCIREKTIRPLSLEEVARLEAAASRPEHAAMRFSLHLMLYCGLRPNEVRRLRADDIRPAEQEIIIRPAVSKTGGGRVVPLRCQPPDAPCPIPGNWEARWRELRRAAGFRLWQADACRHSYASYHAAHFRNLPALQCEMGHADLHLLHTRYLFPVPRRHAAAFWAGRDCNSTPRQTNFAPGRISALPRPRRCDNGRE